ncbi:MAG: efflux RND transporter periplasmic adaptor subunit [Candidatus Omnitrophica bacterium]|nr:efflux RND transporter periplasmic adaptor subunit [Candidatus Omnitrophota bacterium]
MNTQQGKITPYLILVLLALTAAGGYIAGLRSAPQGDVVTKDAVPEGHSAASGFEKLTEAAAPKWWTCSMHPQIKLPSGDMKCPICFMDLIPVEEGSGDADVPELKFSDRERFLAEVETAPVERRAITKTVRLVGIITPDETRLAMISARVAGRLENLFVDYTGIEVRKDDHLVEIYSPELYSAQQELLQAIRTQEEMKGSDSSLMKRTGESLIEAAKGKLLRLGLTEVQVEEVIAEKKPKDTLTIYSPTRGIVTRREGTEGMYVEEGTPIYTIADLSEVWVFLDAYESDMKWLHYGQHVHFETEAYPGETFEGTLSFISPVLDERSRTVKLRVNVPNPDRRLKPGMFVRATIFATPATGGKVIAPELADKWICPMHPEVVEDLFGFCPVCSMRLETAKSLGYEVTASPENLPLVIPDSAPLITGKRAVVYVEENREDGIYYVGRTIELGSRADGFYLVERGLAEGERVVTRGNFKIDSALQIQAKPSMLNPPDMGEEAPGSGTSKEPAKPTPPLARLGEAQALKVRPVLAAYLAVQKALAEDSFEAAAKAAGDLRNAIQSLPSGGIPEQASTAWAEDSVQLRATIEAVVKAPKMEELRAAFSPLSNALLTFVGHFGNVSSDPLKEVFCPMALENGAFWLQTGKQIANPYYGASMLRCGEFRRTFESAGGDPEVEAPAPTPTPAPKVAPEVNLGPVLSAKFKAVLGVYLALQLALSQDSFEGASKAVKDLGAALAELPVEGAPAESGEQWKKDRESLTVAFDPVSKAADIETLRKDFFPLSNVLIEMVRRYGNLTDTPVKHAFCPMALENGAPWIQTGKMIANPYYGAKMLRCGEFRETFPVAEVGGEVAR